MADLTMDAPIRLKGQAYTEIFLLDTASSLVVYKGQPLIINAGTDTTHAQPYLDAVDVDPADICLGIAAEQKTIVAADPETQEIAVYTWPTIIGFKNTTLTNEDLGKIVYMSDSGTLSLTATDNPQIGNVFKTEDGYVYVKLSTPQVCASAT